MSVALIIVLVIVNGCIPDFGEPVGTLRRGVLASGNGQRYHYVETGNSLVAYAGAPFDNDDAMEAFWSTDGPYIDNAQVCTTWRTTARSSVADNLHTRPLQPGVALRIAPSSTDGSGLRAITLTERADWSLDPLAFDLSHFDVSIWDTLDTAEPVARVASFDLTGLVGAVTVDGDGVHDAMTPPPWHVCARTFDDQFTFKVWTQDQPEPAWDDPIHVFTTTLPDGWDYPGYGGGVIGSIHANQSATFSDLEVIPTCLAPDMTPTEQCQSLIGPTTTTPTTERPSDA